MKKILSTNYSDTGFNLAALLLRVCFGVLIFLDHGIPKLTKFNELQYSFFDPIHMGHRWSLILVLIAEIICSLFLALGLFSRIAAFLLLINMFVAVFVFHKGQAISQNELGILYLVVFFALLLFGPGKYSVDAMSGK